MRMMKYVRIDREADIALLLLDRPPVKAVDLDLLKDARETIETLCADDGVGAIFITGK